MIENKPCPKCGAYNGEHSPRCSLITFESAKKELEKYYQLWLDRKKLQMEYQARYCNWVRKANQRAEIWEGKYRIVKTENNALRKKVSKQEKKNKPTGEGYKKWIESDKGIHVEDPVIIPLTDEGIKTKEER